MSNMFQQMACCRRNIECHAHIQSPRNK
uniref:Uncharacterized protein n=1 Tax=Anguilla anguilla TaxID=7936 RepID=A0A0E9VZG2_ANGAN